MGEGGKARHVEVVRGAKEDFPGQEDTQPSQRSQAVQVVARVSSYQSMTGERVGVHRRPPPPSFSGYGGRAEYSRIDISPGLPD